MSRFADPRATRTVQLGPCECPGTPHTEGDWARIRSDLSAAEIATLLRLDTLGEQAAAETVAPFVVEWNLLDNDGAPMPVDGDALFLLDNATSTALGTALSEQVVASSRLPNRSAAPSPASPRGSGSRTRTATRTPGT